MQTRERKRQRIRVKKFKAARDAELLPDQRVFPQPVEIAETVWLKRWVILVSLLAFIGWLFADAFRSFFGYLRSVLGEL